MGLALKGETRRRRASSGVDTAERELYGSKQVRARPDPGRDSDFIPYLVSVFARRCVTGGNPTYNSDPSVGGELCAKHHWFTRASCNSAKGSSVTSGDIGPVGEDQQFFGVDDEDDEAKVLAKEVSEGGSGEATLGGVDSGEDHGNVNIGIPSLISLVSPCAFANLNLVAGGVSVLPLDSLDEGRIGDDG